MITVEVRGDMLVITVDDETAEIPLWLIRSWQEEASHGIEAQSETGTIL